MKLLVCVKCSDVFALRVSVPKSCHCGLTTGQYRSDDLTAEYEGPCFPIGFNNTEFIDAMRAQPKSGLGREFGAFIIPKNCFTMIKKDKHFLS